jgi:hypothetical protein
LILGGSDALRDRLGLADDGPDRLRLKVGRVAVPTSAKSSRNASMASLAGFCSSIASALLLEMPSPVQACTFCEPPDD